MAEDPRRALKARYEQLYAEGGLADDPRFYRWIVKLLHPQPRQRLLDVACGEGLIVREALRRALEAYGLDIAEAAVRKARSQASGGGLIVGDAEALPFASDTFDYVTCLGSLENMPDPWEAVAEIRRVTTTQGLICILVPNMFWLGDVGLAWFHQRDDRPFQPFERRATRSGWRNFLLASGLIVEQELRYNKPAVLFRGGKLKSLRKCLIRSTLNLIAPFNLSLNFVYVCRKARAIPTTIPEYWLWEARQSWSRA